MPWRECCKMDERLRFVARFLNCEKMAQLCREFDISRKTGYRIFGRYKKCGLVGWPLGPAARWSLDQRVAKQPSWGPGARPHFSLRATAPETRPTPKAHSSCGGLLE
jgi:hypothetical protein